MPVSSIYFLDNAFGDNYKKKGETKGEVLSYVTSNAYKRVHF